MKNFITTSIATLSTAIPEITNQIETIDPGTITEGTSLLVQVLTAILAMFSFFKGLKKSKTPKQ